MTNVQRIENVSASKVQFGPGDRLLVKTFGVLSKDGRRNIYRTMRKWIGRDDVPILIYDASQMEVKVEKS